MPFAYGTLGSHSDVLHYGSAKRDTASGVAGLDSSGVVLGPGPSLKLTRTAGNDIHIIERTSGEYVIIARRVGGNDFTLYNNTVAGGKIIQDSSMKDVASGIASLDASGNVLAPGPAVYLTRDGSNNTLIYERTSAELAAVIKRLGATNFLGYIVRNGTSTPILHLDANGDIPHMRPKAASANLRHSHDAEILVPQTVYTKAKTFIFANGISGTLRVYFELNPYNAGNTFYGRLYKNGVALGTEQSTPGGIGYVAKTEDVNVGVVAPGDTLELWAHNTVGFDTGGVQNFRLSYDNAADTILVAGVSTS